MYGLASLALLGALWLFFDDLLERRHNPNRTLSVTPGAQELTLQRNRAGHYVVPGTLNGQPVSFLLDTGATQVSIPAHLGDRLGIIPGPSARTATANGPVTVRLATIESLKIGPFTLKGIAGQLNPGQLDDQILLGMSALRHLEFSQRGDVLILRRHSSP